MAIMNAERVARTTKIPALCPHCRKVVSSPPGWLGILKALAPGSGQAEPEMTVSEVADRIGVSRQRAAQLMFDGLKAGVLEGTRKVGASRYKRTWYGRQLLGRWKTAGWRCK